MRTTLIAAALAAALAAPVAADRADEDLAAVKRAVGSSTVAEARPPAEDPRPAEEPVAKPRARAEQPRWFRVRIVEKGEKHARLSLNLPLALVRAAGEDWRLPGCDGRKAGGPTLGEILRGLGSGQNLLEIEGDDATVRVWVE